MMKMNMRISSALSSPERWCRDALLIVLVLIATTTTMAFVQQGVVVRSPRTAFDMRPKWDRETLTTTSPASQRIFSGLRESRRTGGRLHLIMANAPIDEDEKLNSNNNNRRNPDDDDDEAASSDNSNDWIPSSDGGFIPNIRNLLGRPPSPQTNSKKKTNIVTVTSLLEYKQQVVDETDRLVCVRFYAPWCRACKAVAPMFAKLAAQYDPTKVKFVEVPLTKDNAFLMQGLGVPSLPYGHIYHPTAGLVEERKMNRKVFGKLAYILSTYVHGECVLEDYDRIFQTTNDQQQQQHDMAVGAEDEDDHDTVLMQP